SPALEGIPVGVVRTFRSAVSGRPEGLHYIGGETPQPGAYDQQKTHRSPGAASRRGDLSLRGIAPALVTTYRQSAPTGWRRHHRLRVKPGLLDRPTRHACCAATIRNPVIILTRRLAPALLC